MENVCKNVLNGNNQDDAIIGCKFNVHQSCRV